MRKNIIVRMGTPRFMRKGDELTIPVIVHNYLEQSGSRSRSSLDIASVDKVTGDAQQITVPSKGDVETRALARAPLRRQIDREAVESEERAGQTRSPMRWRLRSD